MSPEINLTAGRGGADASAAQQLPHEHQQQQQFVLGVHLQEHPKKQPTCLINCTRILAVRSVIAGQSHVKEGLCSVQPSVEMPQPHVGEQQQWHQQMGASALLPPTVLPGWADTPPQSSSCSRL